MAEVKRKKGEQFDALYRRFQRRIQSSGKILQARKIRFRKKDETSNKRHSSALRREEKRTKFEYEIRTGKRKIEPRRHSRGRR
ncbi:hypothetical protein KJ781_02235 [Patescibacteria group bacterium]|nr:hypothetical protein [Patescibacteria group bacterium]MBU1448593.1 hypothetical protein [Patescibacteria group bacterium]MBU2612965.1 hypothetical protein [Patescibacteria group bacterium]